VLTVGSLFSGCGGFDLGFTRVGFDLRWQVEIDPDCCAVLTRHWPTVRKFRDVNAVVYGRARNRQRQSLLLEPVDVIVGGFPCQDVSVAGQRAGLAGSRSGLFFAFMRAVRLLKPQIVIIENVPGLFTASGGRDFHTVLSALAECGLRRAYRVLDSQYFGVPQRRRRVFLVASARASGIDPAAILFESVSSDGHSAASGETGTDVAACLRGRAHGAGNNEPGRGGEDDVNLVTYALGSHSATDGDVSNQNHARGGPVGLGISREMSHSLRGGRTQAIAFNWQSGQAQEQYSADVSPSLQVGQTVAVCGVHANQRGELRTSPLAGSLNGSRSGKQFEGVALFQDSEYGVKEYPSAGTLRAGRIPEHQMVLDVGERARALVGSMFKRHDDDTDTLIAAPITASAGHHGHSSPRGDGADTLIAATLLEGTLGGGPRTTDLNGNFQVVPGQDTDTQGVGVRRLTPLECERLQNFPDGWSCLCGNGQCGSQFCTCPDTPRYRMMGNAVTVSVSEWIARRVKAVLEPSW
jgi:DNA (cytosine-5)-methyltransferase 1